MHSPEETGASAPPPAASRERRGSAIGKTLLVALPLVIGLGFSVALLVDYLRPAPVFCDEGGGCARIRASVFSSWLHVPVPVYGVAGFVVLVALALARGRTARAAHLGAASVGALVALGLLVLQGVLGAVCPLCVVVDVSTILAFVVALLRALRGWDVPFSLGRTLAGAGALALVAVGAPVTAGMILVPRVVPPAAVTAEMQRTPPSKVCVVDYVDFECPFCRLTHAEIAPVIEAHARNVRVVRRMVPLRMHPHAMDAARAACCGETMGKGDEMADALFRAEDLTPAGCEKVAATVGLDTTSFRACVADPKTEQRIQAESAEFHSSNGHGLPTIWIDRQKLEGAQPREEYEQAMSRALRDHG